MTYSKRHHIHPVNWSLTTILLAACGGGGGGGGSAKPVTNAVILPSGIRQFDVPEGKVEPTAPLQVLTPAEQARASTDLTLKSVTVSKDGLTIRLVYSSPHGDFVADARLLGPDAAFFKFVTQGENSTVVFRHAPDFEQPLDVGRDNHYDFKVTVDMPSNVPYYSFYNNIPGFRVKVTDVTGDADPTPPSDVSTAAQAPAAVLLQDGRTGITVKEGEQLVTFDTVETVAAWTATDHRIIATRIDPDGASGHYVLTLPDGRLTSVEYELSGPDAALFSIVKVGDYGGVRFRQAPDYERPRDVGGDNIYDVTLIRSGSSYRPGDLDAVFGWRILVTDVVGDSDPTPPEQALQAPEIL